MLASMHVSCFYLWNNRINRMLLANGRFVIAQVHCCQCFAFNFLWVCESTSISEPPKRSKKGVHNDQSLVNKTQKYVLIANDIQKRMESKILEELKLIINEWIFFELYLEHRNQSRFSTLRSVLSDWISCLFNY